MKDIESKRPNAVFKNYYTLSSAVHVQKVQVCYMDIHVPWWFAAFLPPSPISGISHLIIPLHPPHPCCPSPSTPLLTAVCDAHLPVSTFLIVQHLPMSDNIWCLVFCSYVSLLRMMVSRFIHVLTKNKNSFFLWLHSIPRCICATFSLSSLSLMDIWVGSKSLLFVNSVAINIHVHVSL